MVFDVRESIYDGFRVTGCVLYHLLGLDIASDIDELVVVPVGGGYVKATHGHCLCQHVDSFQYQLAD